MANHGYVRFSKPITADEADKSIRAIVNSIFGGLLVVTGPHEFKDGGHGWEVDCPNTDYEFEVWLSKPTLFEFRHPLMGQWNWWAQLVVQESLARVCGGEITDEGVEGSWKPALEKHRTFKAWLERLYPKTLMGMSTEAIINGELKCLPKALRNLPPVKDKTW
jgi:hypothetical protein